MKLFIRIILFLCVYSNVFSQNIAITIDPSVKYQTIESFGASDCWSVKDIGHYWADDIRERVTKELFSTETYYDGSPQGIGLTQWRFNLGAGSIDDEAIEASRRTESFLNEAGTGYDWTKQAGQQWFMDKARSYGCGDFVAFSNSPLVQFTKNGKGYANVGESEANLQDDKYDDYAEYCADVMKYFEDQGKGFKYFSPVNEPQYNWDGPGQEGTPWQNHNISKLARELDNSFQKRGLKTKLLIAEAGDWTYLYQTKTRASNQIYEFFDKNSSNYIGDLASMMPVIGAHSYWTTGTNSGTKNTRIQTYNKAKEYGLSIFQTEYSMLSGGEGLPEDLGESTFIDNALFLGKIIYSDLEHAQVTSWAYWTAFGIDLWGHKNRFLLTSVVPGGGPFGSMTSSGTADATKNLWVLGNYSYFIRPGYTRVRLKGANDMAGLMGSAYLAPDSSRVVAVYVNASSEIKNITTDIQNIDLVPVTNKRYVTSSLYDLKKYGSAASEKYEAGKSVAIPARSVTTVVYELTKGSSSNNIETESNQLIDVYPNPVFDDLSISSLSPLKAATLYDTSGKIALEQNYDDENDIIIPMSGMANGIYILQINTENNTTTRRIIKR